MDIAISINKIAIRLTSERWFHLVENHDELAGYYNEVLETVEDPDLLFQGYRGSIMASRNYGHKRYLMVIYKESSGTDGFIITAFFTDKINRKKAIWKKQ